MGLGTPDSDVVSTVSEASLFSSALPGRQLSALIADAALSPGHEGQFECGMRLTNEFWKPVPESTSACRGIGITVSLHSLVLSGTGFQNSLVRRMPHSNCPSWPGESAASAMRAESRRPGRADENRLASETVETTSESGVPRSCLTSMRLATAREGRREPPPVPGAPRAPPEGRRIAFHGPLPLPFCFAWAFACVSRYFCWVGWWLRASLKKSSALMMYTRVVLVVTTDTACFVLFTSACSPKNCPGPMMLISRSLGAHPA